MRAERCESYYAIDLAWLRRRKMLQPGRSSSIQWSHCGRPAGSIGIVARTTASTSSTATAHGVTSGRTCGRSCLTPRRGHPLAAVGAGLSALDVAGPAECSLVAPSDAAGVTGSTTARSTNRREAGR